MKRKIEILAPAGSYACFQAAVQAGADAVYAGGPRFGARAYADNFTEEELIRAIREAHVYGVRFYLTVNTLLKEHEIEELYDYLAPFYKNGLDAVIVQDVGVFEFVRTHFPDLDIHVSTQMTVTGADGASFLEEQGAVRVVPARELSLNEIREIREKTNLEIECFVHGALCYCYSGQCLMSSMIGGRSGNRGQCAQPCRLPYTVDGEKKHFLSLKDICTLELIPELIEAGIDSFKIEGRMKKPEYVAGVTAMYRKYTDLYLKNGKKGYTVSDQDREMLMDLYNRGGFHTGYFKKHNGRDMLSLDRPNHAGVAAIRMTSQKGRGVRGIALTRLNSGDVIETGRGKDNYTIGKEVRAGETLSFLVPKGMMFSKGTVFHRVRNNQIIEELKTQYSQGTRKRSITGTLFLEEGSPAYLTVTCESTDDKDPVIVTVMSDTIVQAAQSRPLEEKQIHAKLSKTGNTPFFFQILHIEMGAPVFLPVQELNSLRRNALAQLQNELEEKYCRENADMKMSDVGKTRCQEAKFQEPGVEKPLYTTPDASAENLSSQAPSVVPYQDVSFSVLVETREQLACLSGYVRENPLKMKRIYVDSQIIRAFSEDKTIHSLLQSIRSKDIEVYAALPHVFRSPDRVYYQNWINQPEYRVLDGVLVRSLEEIRLLESTGFDKKTILDHNLYVFNSFAKKFWREKGISEFTAPAELTCNELGALGIHEAELIAYGRLPVMLSAQCITRTRHECRKANDMTCITDRYGNNYPVRNCCNSCYNVIYDTSPLCLSQYLEEIRALRPLTLRLQFSIEGAEEMKKTLRQFELALQSGTTSDTAIAANKKLSCTDGHFWRGII